MQNKRLIFVSAYWLLLLIAYAPLQAETFEINLSDGNAVPVEQFSTTGNTLLVWLPSEFGLSERLRATAEKLAESGFETWLPDLHAAWFIPVGRYSLQEVSNASLLEIFQQAQQKSGKKIFIVAPGRVAAKALETVHLWQQKNLRTGQLGGAILLHPKLYTETPQGGEKASFLPIASAVNIPIYLLQPENSAHYWRSRSVQTTLGSGGAAVFLHDLMNVSDGFYARPDHTETEAVMTRRLPAIIAGAIQLLEDYDVPLRARPIKTLSLKKTDKTGPASLLKPYTANTTTPPLTLSTLDDKTVSLNDYNEQVVVLNFWATWCPPCVEEIPSLERLKTLREDKGLAVVSVDVGETTDTIKQFLADKPISFPVLLDPDARAFKDWNNYAFPTTFILDRQHKIRYARFGAFAWDSEEVLDKLDSLLDEDPIHTSSK